MKAPDDPTDPSPLNPASASQVRAKGGLGHRNETLSYRHALASSAFAGTNRAERFSDFPTPLYSGRIAPVRIVSHHDHEFRTMMRDASGEKPNFAGHYILTSWGCGANCIQTVAIDIRTGRTTWLPFTLFGWPVGVDDPRQFRSDSRLLILRGQRDETGPNTTWYELIDDRGFRLVATPSAGAAAAVTAATARTR